MSKRVCPNGHIIKDRKALKCPQCGADLPPLPKRKHTGLYIIGGLILLIIIIVALSNGGDEGSSTQTANTSGATRTTAPSRTPRLTTLPEASRTPKPTATSRPTDAPPTATPEPKQLYLGDIVEQDGYALCALTVEDPATPGILFTAEEGKKLVAVEIILANLSVDAFSVNPLNASLLDSEGLTYQVELGGRDGQISTVTLDSGEKARGWVSFQIPESAQPSVIKYSLGLFSSAAIRASLAPAPAGYAPDQTALAALPATPATHLGATLEESGYSLSASTVEDPATPGMFYTAPPGFKLVAVEITVGNVSADELAVNALYAVLRDSEGYVYTAELAGRDDQIDTVKLAAGEKAKGWVAFTIPADAVPAALKYQVDMFPDKYLVVGLTQ